MKKQNKINEKLIRKPNFKIDLLEQLRNIN